MKHNAVESEKRADFGETGADFTLSPFSKEVEKSMQKGPKSRVFGYEMDTGAPQGRLILQFFLFLVDSENRRFFDVALGRRKINKNPSLERPGAEKVAPGITEEGVSALVGMASSTPLRTPKAGGLLSRFSDQS